jgi:large subunit ribosomal protein L13|uniref:50S ribosomal protein L13 n=1 Tax=Prosthecobacter sp. TaxID=1965333 RepID=UPI003784A186
MKTFSAKAQEQNPTWWVIDAKNQILGDVAVAAANLLRGKTKPTFTPHVDTGDFVVVLNAADVRLSGKKEQQKIYTSKAGYVGNQKVENVESVRARRPELLVERAVKGMVPHNSLGRSILGKLKIYSGAEHPHEAQNPKPFAVA